MKEFTYDKQRFELEMLLGDYKAMFNSKDSAPFAYASIQKINPAFPHIDDENFWNKLNTVFLENYNMDLEKLEEYIVEGVKGEPFRRMRIFELIKEKKRQ
jgi:hypothetical protein